METMAMTDVKGNFGLDIQSVLVTADGDEKSKLATDFAVAPQGHREHLQQLQVFFTLYP